MTPRALIKAWRREAFDTPFIAASVAIYKCANQLEAALKRKISNDGKHKRK